MRQFRSWKLLPISLADHEQWKKYLQSFFSSAVPISKCNKPSPSWEFSLHYIPVIYRHSHGALFIMLLNGLSPDIRPLNVTIVAFDCKMSAANSRAIICKCASPSIISLRWIVNTLCSQTDTCSAVFRGDFTFFTLTIVMGWTNTFLTLWGVLQIMSWWMLNDEL